MTAYNSSSIGQHASLLASRKNEQQQQQQQQQKQLHVAPMLHVSNREFRALFRILTQQAVLWMEMVVDETVYHSRKNANVPEHLLDPVDPNEHHHPVICQIGGIRPDWTASATRAILAAGYNYEINLNLDCPSDRVQGKQFGAVLMKYPEKTVELLQAMQQGAGDTPISVKCRIGIDDLTEFDWLVQLIETLSTACQRFILHARPVILQGLSPAQNRSIPPLNYGIVYRICERFPDLQFWINGGIRDLQMAKAIAYGSNLKQQGRHHVVVGEYDSAPNGSCTAPPISAPSNLRGVMLGRAAMDNPSMFWDVDRYFYHQIKNPMSNRRQVLDRYCAFLEQLYPRRCCDDNPEPTCRIPAPRILHTKQHCTVCCGHHLATRSKENVGTRDEPRQQRGRAVKITSRVIDRSLKPFLGMFHQQAGSKTFRRSCFDLSRDLKIRNCGPAFILRQAVGESISDKVLDQPFVRTEDL